MAQTDPAAVAARWAQNLGAAVPKMQASVQAMTQSPTQAAAAAAQKWQQAMMNPATLQKWQSSLQAVTLASWQQSFLQKGIPRVASGAQAATGKFQSFMTNFLPYVNSQAAQVRQMPKNSLQDSIARATAMIQANAAYAGRH